MSDEPTPRELAQAIERRALRNAIRLKALVLQHFGVTVDASAVAEGAAASADGVAWVLVEGGLGLGAALAWSRRSGASRLHVIAVDGVDAGAIARQASELRESIEVWQADGRELTPVVPTPHVVGEGPPDAPDLVALLRAEGLDVVVEGDRLTGEFRGLELVRIVRALDDGEPILEVGVGRFDREMTAMMHGDLDGRASIARVLDQVRDVRRPDGPHHPLARLVPERWLRSTLLDDPALIGCDELIAAPASEVRDRLRTRGVAAATGTRGGHPVVVVCSVGVDLEAAIQAIDTRLALDPDAVLLFCAPAADLVRSTVETIQAASRPAEVVAAPEPWRR